MNNKTFTVENYLESYRDLLNKIDTFQIENTIELIKNKINEKKAIYTCGNGGSAHTASHFITDWKKMYHLASGKKIYAHALTDNIGLITAYANDLNYEKIFSEQLKPVLNEDDLVICISGSGNSKNILSAIEYANSINADTLGILGYDGGQAIKKCKHKILVKCFDMQLVEDFHLQIGHMVMKSICNTEIKK